MSIWSRSVRPCAENQAARNNAKEFNAMVYCQLAYPTIAFLPPHTIRARGTQGSRSLYLRLIPRTHGWNHPNPARIGFGEFQRSAQRKAFSGSIGERESRAHAAISSDSP